MRCQFCIERYTNELHFRCLSHHPRCWSTGQHHCTLQPTDTNPDPNIQIYFSLFYQLGRQSNHWCDPIRHIQLLICQFYRDHFKWQSNSDCRFCVNVFISTCKTVFIDLNSIKDITSISQGAFKFPSATSVEINLSFNQITEIPTGVWHLLQLTFNR